MKSPFFKYAVICSLFILTSCNSSSKGEYSLPVDSNATSESRNLYRNLFQIPQKGFLFGHQDDTLYGVDWFGEGGESDVKRVCGDYPALYGWEIGHLEKGAANSLDSVWFSTMREEIIAAYLRGGINTISWHLDNPVTEGNSWDVSDTTVVRRILPGGSHHTLYCRWLDQLILFFNSLEAPSGEKVPILFRPFHEHMGNWFWWGQKLCSEEEYKALFRFTVDYFRNKGVHQLLYVYSPDLQPTASEYFKRYPGDEYVDVLGLDAYQFGAENKENFIRDVKNALAYMATEGEARKKPIVFSETGLEAIPQGDWWSEVLFPIVSQYPISYVMVWRNAYDRKGHYYAPYPGQVSASDFVDFYNHPRTLFNSDLKDSLYR